MSAVITGIVIGIAILGAGALALRDKAIAQRCEDAVETNESYAAACGFNCPVCNDRDRAAVCTCQGDCCKRGCPWPMWATALETPQWRRELAELIGEKR